MFTGMNAPATPDPQAQQREQLAKQLMLSRFASQQGAMPMGSMASRRLYVPPSPFQHLAKMGMGQAGLFGRLRQSADSPDLYVDRKAEE